MLDEVDAENRAGMTARNFAGSKGVQSTLTDAEAAAAEASNYRMSDSEGKSRFTYKNKPMDNPKAAKDIVENPNAVYGYSPKPDSSLNEYVKIIDWTDQKQVAQAQAERIKYHKKLEIEKAVLKEKTQRLTDKGYSIKDIAKLVVDERNKNRMQIYIKSGNIKGLEAMKIRNIRKYNNADGPTADYLFNKYGSWEDVIYSSIRSNPGMDACTGLYDIYYGGNINVE